ncbi:MAG: tRNA lysidine(34) synthetase TilS, partial [Spirochaetales bacterium]|nr:tRNA lysidine(34) synthetase TilS [Spirochaetales bacterium]
MNLIEKVNKFLKAHNISRDSKILVAFSGGVDSSVLLHLLSQIFPTQQIFAYHVQHMLRSEAESAADLSFCQKFAAQLGVNFSYTRISEGLIESHSKANRCGIEASARHFRYAVISEHVTALDIDYVALGHHLDDNLETVLLRFLSGSSVFGLRGIPPVRDLFIRPMAEISTAEISNYAEENSIGYVVDKSNLDNGFRRNLIRNKIFPYLLESFPGLRTSVHSISKKSSMVADFVDRELARKIAWRQDGESYYIEFPSYLELDEFLKHEILYRGFDFVSRSSGDSKRLPTRFVEESIGRLLREGDKVVGNGIVVEVFLDRLYFYEIGNSLQEKLYFTVDKVFFNKNLNTPFGKIFIKILDKPLKEKEKNVT